MTREFSMDRRAYLKTVGAVGASATLAGCQGGSDDTIAPGTNAEFAPFEFTQDGEVVGFDVDFTEAVLDRAGYEMGEWVDIDFGSLIPSLNDGDIDLIAAAMTIEPDRQEQIAFSDPYWEANQSVLVSEDGDFQPEAVEDLAGRRVGAQAGTTGEGQIGDLIEAGTISESDYRQYDNYSFAVQDLLDGNVDAVVVDVPVAENFTAERSVVVAFQIDTGEQYGLGMRQDDDRITDINDAIAEIREDGTYDDLVAEWHE